MHQMENPEVHSNFMIKTRIYPGFRGAIRGARTEVCANKRGTLAVHEESNQDL
jgi:hypothetical protein